MGEENSEGDCEFSDPGLHSHLVTAVQWLVSLNQHRNPVEKPTESRQLPKNVSADSICVLSKVVLRFSKIPLLSVSLLLHSFLLKILFAIFPF